MTEVERVADFYSKVVGEYKKEMKSKDMYSIHYGYVDDDHSSWAGSIKNMTRVVADAVGVADDDRVLHCGCGVGGPATWIAQNLGASVVGVNINEDHIMQARQLADERGVHSRAEFRYDDMTRLNSVEDGSFDVVWALESHCYVENKVAFLEKARQALGEEGRLVIVDGVRLDEYLSVKQRRLLDGWHDNWRIAGFKHIDEFSNDIRQAGFKDVCITRNDKNVLPFARKLCVMSIPGYVSAYVRQLLGDGGQAAVDHAIGYYYQYWALRAGVWSHVTTTARL